MKYFQLVLN